MQTVDFQMTVPEDLSEHRLDFVVAKLCKNYSRAQHQIWIKSAATLLNGQQAKCRDRVSAGQIISIHTTLDNPIDDHAQPIPINIVYQDDALLIVNKPAGLVTHPGAGNPDQTLVNALLHADPSLKHLPRAGIIHRLDKDTSGLLVVARRPEVLNQLVQAMQSKQIQRHYEAIVFGEVISGGTVSEPIGRHPRQRTQMAVTPTGKPATTHYRLSRRYKGFTHLHLQLETGRTHQIRVHMKHLGYPIVGDRVYTGRSLLPKHCHPDLLSIIRHTQRQALHAAKIALKHPVTDETIEVTADLPDDIGQLLNALNTYATP